MADLCIRAIGLSTTWMAAAICRVNGGEQICKAARIAISRRAPALCSEHVEEVQYHGPGFLGRASI